MKVAGFPLFKLSAVSHPHRTFLWRHAVAWLVVLGWLVLLPGPASAHASLVRSTPAGNATLTDPPHEARLWFSEPVSPAFSTVTIIDGQGRAIPPVSIRVGDDDPTLLIVTLPDLPPGLYNLRWKVLSETDGHFTQGPLVFGVGSEVSAASAATASEPASSIPLVEVFLRWLNFAGLMGLVGAAGVAAVVLKPSPGALRERRFMRLLHHRVLRWAFWCTAAALLAGGGVLGWQVVVLRPTLPENAALTAVVWQLVSHTRWGQMWLARQAVLAAAMFCLRRRYPLPVTGLLAVGAVGLQASMGHASGLSRAPALAVTLDALHIAAAGIWVGGLLALVVASLLLYRQTGYRFVGLSGRVWKRFSPLAVLGVLVLVASGLYSTGRQAASVDAVLTTRYGQFLAGKLSLVLLVGMVGLVNSMLLHPRLAAPLARLLKKPPGWTPVSPHRLSRLVLVEAGLGLLVVLATGVITTLPTANGPEFSASPADTPAAFSQQVDDMVITFSARPNRPGQNLFSIRAVSVRKPPPAEMMRLIVRLTYLDQDFGRMSVDAVEIEPGLYQVGGNYFTNPGRWKVQVIARRRGLKDASAQFQWVVPPASARAEIVSTRPLEPVLTITAGMVILLATAGLTGLYFRRRTAARPRARIALPGSVQVQNGG